MSTGNSGTKTREFPHSYFGGYFTSLRPDHWQELYLCAAFIAPASALNLSPTPKLGITLVSDYKLQPLLPTSLSTRG